MISLFHLVDAFRKDALSHTARSFSIARKALLGVGNASQPSLKSGHSFPVVIFSRGHLFSIIIRLANEGGAGDIRDPSQSPT